MNQQALEAAAKAAHYAINSVGPVWDCWPDSHKAVYFKLAIAALTAYAEACGERVVWTNNTSNDMAICRMNRNGEAFGPVTLIKHGYEIIERKVGT